MGLSRSLGALAGALLLALASSATGNEVCDPAASRGPISLIILASPDRVYELARAVAGGVPVVANDASTIVFQDGRVITSDVESATSRLNELGWGKRRINVVATFGRRRAGPARVRG